MSSNTLEDFLTLSYEKFIKNPPWNTRGDRKKEGILLDFHFLRKAHN